LTVLETVATPIKRGSSTGNFAVNVSAKVSGIVPLLPACEYRIEIKTQYTIGGIDLKQLRVFSSGFIVMVGG